MRISNIFLALIVGVYVLGLIPFWEYVSLTATILFFWLVICDAKICVSSIFIIGVAALLFAVLPAGIMFEAMFMLEFLVVVWISNLIRTKV